MWRTERERRMNVKVSKREKVGAPSSHTNLEHTTLQKKLVKGRVIQCSWILTWNSTFFYCIPIFVFTYICVPIFITYYCSTKLSIRFRSQHALHGNVPTSNQELFLEVEPTLTFSIIFLVSGSSINRAYFYKANNLRGFLGRLHIHQYISGKSKEKIWSHSTCIHYTFTWVTCMEWTFFWIMLFVRGCNLSFSNYSP